MSYISPLYGGNVWHAPEKQSQGTVEAKASTTLTILTVALYAGLAGLLVYAALHGMNEASAGVPFLGQ